MRFDTVVGYTYAADTYCPACIVQSVSGTVSNAPASWTIGDVERALDGWAHLRGIDRMDEYSYDSGTFPKVILAINLNSGDYPDVCGECFELLDDGYECAICAGHHGESAHGEPLAQRDTGSRTITDAVAVHVVDGMTICQDAGQDQGFNRLAGLYDDWNDDMPAAEREEYAPEYLDDIDAILTDAGFHAVTDPHQGTWAVYTPVASQVSA